MIRAAFCLLLAATAAQAQGINPVVRDCDWQTSAQFIAEPWEENTRTFANGQTRLALIDTVEPVGGWGHLLILSPPYDVLGVRQCKVIVNGSTGFSRMDFSSLVADYDPKKGLIFNMIVGSYVEGTQSDPVYNLMVVLDQSTGEIKTAILD